MSDRDSVLIIGGGSIGERHLRCFAATGRVEVSLCEVNPLPRAALAARYQIDRAFATVEEALETAPLAAVICTPTHVHISTAQTAVQARAHVLIEKPLSTTFEGVEVLQEECARQRLTAAVAYVYRAHPSLAAMREAVLSGQFGEPVQIVATAGQHFPLYRPGYRDSYYRDHASGGGAVQDALTHVINAGEWLVGPVDRLVADTAHQVLEGVAVEDTAHVLTRHGDVRGSFTLNQHQAPNETTITVICRRGTARFEYHANRWLWMTEPGGEWHAEALGGLERDTLFMRQAEAFLDAIAGHREPLCTLDEAAQTLRVNLAILASAEQGGWQSIHAGEVLHV